MCVLTRAFLLVMLTVCLSIVRQDAALAGTQCQVTDPLTGQCTVWVDVPGHPGTPGGSATGGPADTGSGASCYWDGTSEGITKPPPGPMPCSSPEGYWSNSHGCYVSVVDPPPPAGDPTWQGHEPGDGAVYNCYGPQSPVLSTFWSQNAPASSAAGPSPREVAQLAIDQMDLSAIDIGIVPEPGPDSVGLVGMPVWMWVKGPDQHTFGPITATASAGGITLTATASVLHVTWRMGDGTDVVCDTPGTPYKPSYGRKDSPDCGHIYKKSSTRQPDGVYTVTATSSWVVTWAGAGQTGTIRLEGLARSTQVRIGEAQVLVN